MRNLIRRCFGFYRNLSAAPAILLLQMVACLLLQNSSEAQPPKIALEQSSNGSVEEPLLSPIWIKSHLGKTNSHYAPGSVIPYRAVVTNMPINCPLQIRLSFLTVKNGKHATDFPTNYDQATLEHINEFGSWEPVNPLAGLTGNFTGPTSSEFPLIPNLIVAGPPADQATTQANYLYFLSQYGPQRISAWNANLQMVQFAGYGDRNPGDGGDRLLIFDVSFTATSSPVVFAWGGHIAYDSLIIINGIPVFGYGFGGNTWGNGSSSAAGLTECLSLAQAAASGGGGGQFFLGNTGEITYSLSGGKPINPTSSNKSGSFEMEIADNQKTYIYPNPNKGNATVVLANNSGPSEITLIDITGRIIKSWSEYRNHTLELTSLQSGMYFLNIISKESNKKAVHKVVVLK